MRCCHEEAGGQQCPDMRLADDFGDGALRFFLSLRLRGFREQKGLCDGAGEQQHDRPEQARQAEMVE